MALTRKMLKAMGIGDEQIDQIIDAHSETVDGLKEKLKVAQEDASKVTGMQKEIERLQSLANGDDEYKAKYEKEHADYEALKAQVVKDAANRVKTTLYTEVLKKTGIDEKVIPSILRLTDFDSITVKDDKIDGEDKLVENIKADWSNFIVKNGSAGADPDTPPHVGDPSAFDAMSLADKMRYANDHAGDQAVKNWLK